MEWQYLENQFYNVTKRNFKRALIISNYHDAALLAATQQTPPDPDFTLLYNRYHPLHLVLVTEYNNWKNAGGQQEGSTLNLDQQLDLMAPKLDNWDIRIQIEYPRNTPRYKTIFPDGRKPFYRTGKDTRIEAINTLAQNIGPDAQLMTVHAEVLAYYADLSNARDAQSGKKVGTKMGSTLLEQAVQAAMFMQYRDLGFLINKFGDTPALIAPFFDVQTIRERDQRIFTGTLDPSEMEAILVHTFLADDELRLKITGDAPARFYLGSTTNATDSNFVEITGNHEQTITVNQFGITNYAEHRYLTVVNQAPPPPPNIWWRCIK
ncbi:MAG: hypothetical protein IPH78_11125 [Bacteroidetes bacterium]|nr:hypothetical protein [Bacteroidota bacterium]